MLIKRHVGRLVFAMLFCFVQITVAEAYTVALTKQQVQDAIKAYFPVKHVTPFATLTLSRPVVSLDPISNRIGLAFSMTADVSGLMIGKGKGMIDGDLEYRQKSGAFYLHAPNIKRFEINELPADIAAPVRQALQGLMRQSLPLILVYKLKDDDLNQMLAKSMLSSVTVRNGKLILELSSPLLN